jgi:branched-chain amino acid transport system substrate-binding protein
MQDDQSKTENAVKAVQRVIEQEDVDVILGPYSSGISAAVMGAVEEFGVPMIAPMASDPSIFSADKEWSFMGYPMAGTSWGPDARLLAENGASNAAILRTDVAVHELEAEGAKEELDANGIDHRTWTNKFGAEDLSTQVSQMAGYNPDSVYLITYGGTTLAAIRELINQGVDPDYITGVTTGSETLQDSIGANVNGIFGHSPWSTNLETEQATQVIDAYVGEFQMQPTFHFALGYSSAQAYQKAVEETGTTEKGTVRDYLEQNSIPGMLTGTFEVNDQRRQIGYDWLTAQWQNNEKEILFPEEKATTDQMIWPKPDWGV